MRQITAKFKSTCSETGRTIKKGDNVIYDPAARKVYHMESKTAQTFEQAQEDRSMSNYINDVLEYNYYR